jgi:hypothetical protein
MNVNKTLKAPQNLSTNKKKLKQFGMLILISIEFDSNTTSTHVSGGNELDHILKNYPQDAKSRV